MAVSKAELKRELNKITSRIANTRIGGAKKKKKKTNGGVPAGSTSVANPVRSARKRNSRGGRRGGGIGPSIGNGGRIVLSRDEFLYTVSTVPQRGESFQSKLLRPSADLMPFLYRLSACYQRIRWRALSITWRPAVGTNTNGIVTYGIAYNNQSLSDRHGITSLTPVNDHAVWQSGQNCPLVVPNNMLMSRLWYELNKQTGASTDAYDQAVGTFYSAVTHDAHPVEQVRGEFWIRYTVEMEGTNNV